MAHFPAAGEIVIFDRSCYNLAGVEHGYGLPHQETVQIARLTGIYPVVAPKP
jgi:polyphosphate kinase 2 (PPK2 family)